jgi:DNA polymerase-3 subunit epsilon
MTWHLGRLAALDFETSGKDPAEAFIVTACLALVGGGRDTEIHEWVLSPGDREIPAGAVAIHGVTTDFAREHGRDHKDGVSHVTETIAGVLASGAVLVGHNIGYDLTVLERECAREGVPTLTETLGGPIRPVIDSMVIDKHCAPFRRRVSEVQGPYQLRTTAETYGLPWDDEKAHGSTYDALMSARAVWTMGQIAHRPHADRPDWVKALRTQRFNDIAGLTLDELHDRQVTWAAEDAANLQTWFREKAPEGKRDPNAIVDGSWPVRSLTAEVSS